MTSSRLGALLVATLLASGCGAYVAPVIPAFAPVYTNIKAPLDVDVDNTELGSKVGKSSTTAVLGFAWGDASIATAARQGGIKTIRHVDYEHLNVLFFYSSFTTVVHGD